MRTEIIQIKLKEIDDSLNLITENLPESFEKFSNLGLIKDGIYKKLEFCIESVFDICAIINTDLKLGIPESDETIIDNLIRNNIIKADMGEILKSMKGFRNILVHRYGRINDEIAYSIIKEHLQDFYNFTETIEKNIE
jgi:uncharacterized protein YutE (UPF0331/DUF86 family)